MFVAVNTREMVQRVVVLAKCIWKEHYSAIIGEEQVSYMLREFQNSEAIHDQIDKGLEYYLVIRESNDVGYFAVRADSEDLFLSKLYIKKSESGCGLGSQALRYILDHWEAERIKLTVNKGNAESILFYESRGFIRTGEVVQDIGGGFVMDDYKMEWTR